MDTWKNWKLAELAECVISAAAGKASFLMGIAGPPAAGKSALAIDLSKQLERRCGAGSAMHLPMDGFHLPNACLEAIGLRKFKGRIDTFDAAAYVAHLRRIREGERNFFWPAYSREIHDVVPEGSMICATARLFVTEGNYLLSPVPPWDGVRAMLDWAAYLSVESGEMVRRLHERHVKGGRRPAVADRKIEQTDLPNAREIELTRARADVVLGERAAGDFERWRLQLTGDPYAGP